jgi:argininosuccinate synthase
LSTRIFTAAGEKAKKLGVLKHYDIDSREEFNPDTLSPRHKLTLSMRANTPNHKPIATCLFDQENVEVGRKRRRHRLGPRCNRKATTNRFDITLVSSRLTRKSITRARLGS